MAQGGYPPGCSQADHDRYYGDEPQFVDEDADYEEYRDSPESYEDREDVEVVEVEPRGDGNEDDWRDAA